jgi:hypothetical protein
MSKEFFNPITSSKTRWVETRPDGVRIYSHTARRVAGKFIAVAGEFDWAAFETVEEARKAVVS